MTPEGRKETGAAWVSAPINRCLLEAQKVTHAKLRSVRTFHLVFRAGPHSLKEKWWS